MIRIFRNYHLPQHLDIVFLLVIGILLQVIDGSPFTLKERWKIVWETDLPENQFSPFVQKCIKMLLSIIVTIRCSSTYVYVVAAMLAIFCILKKSASKLMLLWLLVAGIKSICMIFLEGLTGIYVCSAFGKIRKACVEFFVAKALELIFSTYLWASVLHVYNDIENKIKEKNREMNKELLGLKNGEFRRLRARSLIDESTLNKTTCLNKFERTDVPMIILQMLRRTEEMSEDSLLDPGMTLTSVSNLGSFDNIKTSLSLGELGFTDLSTAHVFGLEEDSNLSKQEKVLKYLNLTRSEVRDIRKNKSFVGKDIYNVDDDTWKRVTCSKTRINQPKQPRTEVFIRKISPADVGDEKIDITESRRQLSLRSLFSLLQGDKEVALQKAEEEQDEDYFDSEDYVENEVDHIFMSNLKDGAPIRRIPLDPGLKKTKGVEYAHLYKQDFMSQIGPEVFDKASKLPKLTSITKIRQLWTPRVQKSALALSKKKSKRIKYMDEEYPDKVHNSIEEKSTMPQSVLRELKDYQADSSSHKRSVGHQTVSFEGDESENEKTTNVKFEDEEKDAGEEKGAVKFSEETESKEISESKLLTNEESGGLESRDEEITEITETKVEDKIPEEKEFINKQIPSYTDTPEVPTLEELEEQTRAGISEKVKPTPFFRTRRVRIRWIGQRKSRILYHSQFSDDQGPSDNSDKFLDNSQKSMAKREKEYPEGPQGSKKQTNSANALSRAVRNIRVKQIKGGGLKQIYFVTQLFKKPLFDILITYYNLKKRINLKNSCLLQKEKLELAEYSPHGQNILKQTEKLLNTLAQDPKQERRWKSEVLKRSELRNQILPVTFGNVATTLKKKAAIKKLLKYECYYLMQKFKSLRRTKMKYLEFMSLEMMSKETGIQHERTNGSNESQTTLNVTESIESTVSVSLQRCRSHNGEETPPEVLSCQTSDSASMMEDEVRKIPSDTAKLEERLDRESAGSDNLGSDPEREFLCNQESDEPISLYYSKAANLASPLLDMKGFIYPDHIHYSYKHVKKRGVDVDINGGFPLLMRESLTVGHPVKMEQKWSEKNCEIMRRPMDLSFANTNAFTEWLSKDQNDVDHTTCGKTVSRISDYPTKEVKFNGKKDKRGKGSREYYAGGQQSFKNETTKAKSKGKNLKELKYLYGTKDSMLIDKLLKTRTNLNVGEDSRTKLIQRKPVQISSTQLHSNKGRLSPTYNPAKILQENKVGNEKKKSESQKERTKDMFARLEREALLQNKIVQQQSFGPNRKP